MMDVSEQRLRERVERLSQFPTRNTISEGNGPSAEWIAEQYRQIPGLQVELMTYTVQKGARIPHDMEVQQVIATLPGKSDRRILVGGHFDSLNLVGSKGASDFEKMRVNRAPGANDDGSGTMLAMECAQVLSGQPWEHTLVFVAFSGEEQGLLGSTALASRAKAEGWKIDAVLSCDTVGSSSNLAGETDRNRVRVFSEEAETHQSRELARFIEFTTRGKVAAAVGNGHFGVKLVFRKDRFGRGGDHTPFNNQGFNAVRFIEVYEEYTRQHTPYDLPEHMDFQYLANVTRINQLALAALASAGEPPTTVRVVRDQSHDTSLSWHASSGTRYAVYWRETTSPVWQGALEAGESDHFHIKGINKDDHLFAVGAAGGIPVIAE